MIPNRPSLAATNVLNLLPGEILDKPPIECLAIHDFGRPSIRELRPRGNVGRERQLRVMSTDQHAIARWNEIRLKRIRAHLQRHLKAGAGMFGAIAAGASMADHKRSVHDGSPRFVLDNQLTSG